MTFSRDPPEMQVRGLQTLVERSRAHSGILGTIVACPLRAGLRAEEGRDCAPHASAKSAVAAFGSAAEVV
jgi:hypothetical protein